MTFIDPFKNEIKEWLASTGETATRLGLNAVNDKAYIHRVMRSEISPTAKTIDKVRAYMLENSISERS